MGKVIAIVAVLAAVYYLLFKATAASADSASAGSGGKARAGSSSGDFSGGDAFGKVSGTESVQLGNGDSVAVQTANPKASVSAWAQAVADFESGNGTSGPGARNNNPGNLRVVGNDTPSQDARGFGRFKTMTDGLAALIADLQAKVRLYPNYTLYDITARYAPASDGNDPTHYAETVAQKLGVNPNDTLQQIFGGGQ